MQKKLIAVAVAGALAAPLAMAQSNVTISGYVTAGYENYKLSGATVAVARDTENRISDQSSRIIFAGTEDLGGGLKAWFQIDSRFANDIAGSTLAGGNTGVGLMGNWGKLTIGRWDIHYNEGTAVSANRTGSLQSCGVCSLMSGVGGTGGFAAIANTTRTPNLIMWDSPNWNGVTARLAYSTNKDGNEGSGVGSGVDDGGAWNAAVRYANGPWMAGYSYFTHNAEGPTSVGSVATTIGDNDQRGNRAYVSYDFPMGLRIGLIYDQSKLYAANAGSTSMDKRTAWMLPIRYTTGAHAVYLQYARAGQVGSVADTGASFTMLGYDYALSKRTNVGAYWTQMNNKSNGMMQLFGLGASGASAPGAGEDTRQIYIGMSHSF